MEFFYCIILFLVILSISLVVCAILSRRYLVCTLIYCWFFDGDSYHHYKAVLRYNKSKNRCIPVFNGYITYDPDDSRLTGYYIMNRGLYYRGECLGMRHLKLMMDDLIKRNSLEMN